MVTLPINDTRSPKLRFKRIFYTFLFYKLLSVNLCGVNLIDWSRSVCSRFVKRKTKWGKAAALAGAAAVVISLVVAGPEMADAFMEGISRDGEVSILDCKKLAAAWQKSLRIIHLTDMP